MKLLQISNYYYPHIGGIEQVARDISASASCERKVFCFNGGRANLKDEVDGVQIIRAGCFAKVSSQSLSLGYGKLLKKTFREFNPDVVIFHYPNPFAAHYLLKILKKYPDCKLVLYWHLDIVKQKFLKLFFKGQNDRLIKRAVKIVAATPNHIIDSDCISAHQDKCKILPYAVKDPSVSVACEKATEIRMKNAGKKICFAIGRHIPYKGMEYLVKASKYLSDDYRVFIAGEGPLTPSLKKTAKGDDKIVFLGKISEEDKIAYYRACDIFCFPSITKNEAFGLALAEAMSYSKPAVTFNIKGSGVNYVSLNGETGIEVPNGDVEKFAEAVKTLGENPALAEKYGAAAKVRVAENFTLEQFKKNVNELLKEYEQ